MASEKENPMKHLYTLAAVLVLTVALVGAPVSVFG